MKYYIERLLGMLCMTTLFWSFAANAQRVGMSATAHFKSGENISSVTTFSDSVESCEMDVKLLIKERDSFGHKLVARTDCVKSAAATDKQLSLLTDDLLLEGVRDFETFGHIPRGPIWRIDLCLFFPHWPMCSRFPPVPPICRLILCDFQHELDKYINPIHLEKIRVVLEDHRMDEYFKAEEALWQKHDIDLFGLRLQEIQGDIQFSDPAGLDLKGY